jgi:hypothetical protein
MKRDKTSNGRDLKFSIGTFIFVADKPASMFVKY